MTPLIENGKTIELSTQRGSVAGLAARSDTYVTGSGGANNTNVNIRSTVVVTKEFHLQPAFGGVQLPVQFSGTDVPLMDGQDVTVLMGAPTGASSRQFVRLVNHSTRKWYALVPASGLLKPWKLAPFRGAWTLALWGVGLLLPIRNTGTLGFLAMLGALGYLLYANHMTCKRVDARLDAVAQELLDNGGETRRAANDSALPAPVVDTMPARSA